MQSPNLTHDKVELVVRKEAWINLILGFPAISLFAIGLFFHKSTGPYFKANSLATIAAVLILAVVIYFLFSNSLNNRVKMVINKKGIWTITKGLFEWSNIQYYYFEEVRSDNATVTLLKVKLLEPDKEVKIDISLFNVSERDIEVAIENNSGERKIILLKESY